MAGGNRIGSDCGLKAQLQKATDAVQIYFTVSR